MRKLVNKTATNKLYALLALCTGILSVFIDGDLTGLLLGFMMGVPLFLAKTDLFAQEVPVKRRDPFQIPNKNSIYENQLRRELKHYDKLA